MDKKKYKEECAKRWHGEALVDAYYNFNQWEEMQEYLIGVMKKYRDNSGQVDLAGKYHNPDHSLSGFMHNCQKAIQPNMARLDPFLDFEEHYQTIFLRRGLLQYCDLILAELDTECATPQNQITIFA